MGAQDIQDQGVTVTALGFREQRDRQASTTSNVEGARLGTTGETSVITALSAKAPGVNITRTGGDPGASARIVIRGPSTITGNIEPLFVVDGIPMSNSQFGNGGAGVQEQSRLSDLNPADIESVEVLKGGAAAALFGSRAANGVVLITTKSGARAGGRMNVQFTSQVSVDEVNREIPMQTIYGQGSNGIYQNYSATGAGQSASYGDIIADRAGNTAAYYPGSTLVTRGTAAGQTIRQFTNGTAANPHGGNNSTATYDRFNAVFGTGTAFDNNLSISGSDAANAYFLSVGNLAQQGTIRSNSNYNRTSIRLNAERQFTSQFRVAATTSFARVTSDRVQQGSNTSGIMLGAVRSPADYNMEAAYLGNFTDCLLYTSPSPRD